MHRIDMAAVIESGMYEVVVPREIAVKESVRHCASMSIEFECAARQSTSIGTGTVSIRKYRMAPPDRSPILQKHWQ
ncbi:hypothetical protein G3N57_04875 [Paraburkholderia sp. Se-20369]|nr:hypothetical protein [Paraburkholderia sp. Se-20369]